MRNKFLYFVLMISFLFSLSSCSEYMETSVDTSIGEVHIFSDPLGNVENWGVTTFNNYSDLDKEYFLKAIFVAYKYDLNTINFHFDSDDDDIANYDVILARHKNEKFILTFDYIDKIFFKCNIKNQKFSCNKTSDYKKDNPFHLGKLGNKNTNH